MKLLSGAPLSEGMDAIMPFWDAMRDDGAPALIDAASGMCWSYGALVGAADRVAEELFTGTSKNLVLLLLDSEFDAIVCYLAALRAGHAVLILGAQAEVEDIERLTGVYQPDILLCPHDAISGYETRHAVGRYRVHTATVPNPVPVHPELALLLSTSGSTSSPKAIRLSRSNLAVAALQVVEALEISQTDRAISGLPLSYIYGLSVLHSHLAARASFVLSRMSVSGPHFWKAFSEHAVTSFPAVPWSLQIMRDVGLKASDLPALSKITSSGAPVGAELHNWLLQAFPPPVRVFMMYGLTEASGRIAVLPSDRAARKMGSVGKTVPHGHLACDAEGGIVYRGPNVMMGYASRREDLARGDDQEGTLVTGDTGFLDSDGDLFLTGRSSRYRKLFGIRVFLDDVEAFFAGMGPVAAVMAQQENKLKVFLENAPPQQALARASALSTKLRVPLTAIQLVHRPLPLLPNGKIQYAGLETAQEQSNAPG
jgi:long-chain acyl-CoA synthetase